MPERLKGYEKSALQNGILRSRTIGVAQYNSKEALAWGVTGPGLRATGIDYDLRKARPYTGYENFDFDVPVLHYGALLADGTPAEIQENPRVLEVYLKT